MQLVMLQYLSVVMLFNPLSIFKENSEEVFLKEKSSVAGKDLLNFLRIVQSIIIGGSLIQSIKVMIHTTRNNNNFKVN